MHRNTYGKRQKSFVIYHRSFRHARGFANKTSRFLQSGFGAANDKMKIILQFAIESVSYGKVAGTKCAVSAIFLLFTA